MNNTFLLIGSPGSGKSTFLAVNYILMQLDTGRKNIFLEAADDKTRKKLLEWEDGINNGCFPERTEITSNDTLRMNLWTSPEEKIDIYNIDIAGEKYNIFNLRKEHNISNENEEYIDNRNNIYEAIENALIHVLIIDSTKINNPHTLGDFDLYYNNILTQIKDICNYKYNSHAPLLIIFTKIDKLEKNEKFSAKIFAKKYFPKTYKNYMFFYGNRTEKDYIFGCSIGSVVENEEKEEKLTRFEPVGYKESMNIIIREITKEKNEKS